MPGSVELAAPQAAAGLRGGRFERDVGFASGAIGERPAARDHALVEAGAAAVQVAGTAPPAPCRRGDRQAAHLAAADQVPAGDLVIGDRDGVVVVPQAELAAATRHLEPVAAKEAELHARIAAGDIPSLLQRQPDLEDQITYVD